MIRSTILILFLVFNISQAYCQADTLNQLDANGKKTGWCVAYMDQDLRVLKDSSGASFCMYNYYRNDIWLYRFGEGYGTKKSPVIFPTSEPLKLGNYTLLDGKYITNYKNGNLRSELTMVKGYMTGFKKYYPNGQLEFEIIISEECGAPIQHCLNGYKKDGSLAYKAKTVLTKEK
jgi:hypothetical protein